MTLVRVKLSLINLDAKHSTAVTALMAHITRPEDNISQVRVCVRECVCVCEFVCVCVNLWMGEGERVCFSQPPWHVFIDVSLEEVGSRQ